MTLTCGNGKDIVDRVNEALSLVGLPGKDFIRRPWYALSGGETQRVALAGRLALKPKVLLLDEPTASIDTKGQADFYRLLKELNQDITVLVVSHDLLAISRYVKSVACVNKKLHYHDQAEITGDMLESMYPCTVEEVCPVELVAHGLPHRVLMDHEDQPDD